jgi:hypothetical protein
MEVASRISGAICTVAFSVAKLTLADATPPTWFNAFSTRATQDAQVMPSMASCKVAAVNGAGLPLARGVGVLVGSMEVMAGA